MNYPFIDVIVAVYNGEKYIREAIESIQDQTWQNINIIVADDGSTDQTLTILSDLSQDDDRIKVLALSHNGVSASLNAALQVSTAPYVAFLDADDLWHREKLERQIEALVEGDEKLCFCAMQEFESLEENDSQTHRARKEILKGYSKITFLGEREIFEFHGLFNEDIATGDFVEWFSRLVRAGKSYIMLDEVLAYRRIHSSNTTRNVSKNAYLELLKKHLDEKRIKLA